MYSYVYVEELQKTHSSVYKKFFAKYDMVISLPHLFRFGHALGKGSSFLSMRQKIPHQLFLGVNRTERKGCSFTSMENFDLERQIFVQGNPYEFIRNIDDIAVACTQVMEQAEMAYGIDIGLLTEYPKGYGTSFNTLLCTLIAVALFIEEQKITLEVIKNYSFQYTHLFDDISLLACYIKFLATGSAGSCLPFVALQKQRDPVFQLGKIDFSLFSKDQLRSRLRHLSRLVEGNNSGTGQKMPLGWHHLICEDKKIKTTLPIDVALIHLGDSFESLREKEQALLSLSTDQRVTWFDEFTDHHNLALTLGDSLLQTNEVYGHMSSLLYTRLFYTAMHALQQSSENYHLREMIAILKDMGFYHCLIERQYEIITLLHNLFFTQKTFSEEMCAFLPLTPVKTGGTFLAVIPRHGERSTLERMIDMIYETHGYKAKLLYASRKEDATTHGGVVVHQYISESVFSAYITQGTIQLIYADGQKRLDEYDLVLQDPAVAYGITFDTVKRKVLVQGERVNHKVLCSQSATIEIILTLLEHIGEFLPNNCLPPSAYSKNKNEMISKILLPFQEILASLGTEPLEVICSGTLYEWTICLKKKPTCIQVIQYAHL